MMVNRFLKIDIGTENEYLHSWFRSHPLEPPRTLLRKYNFGIAS